MKKGDVDHGERHPKVLLICDDAQELVGVCDVISSQVSAFKTVWLLKDIHAVVASSKPPVIIMAMSQVSRAVEIYTELAQLELLNYPHENILLCENKESGVAFRCCMKGLFSDYYVYKPMYENYRLRMILHNSLMQHEKNLEVTQLREEHFGKIDDSIRQLIDDAARCGSECENSLKEVKQHLVNVFDGKEISGKLVEKFKQERIMPMLAQLEHTIEERISQLTNSLQNNRGSVKELAHILSESLDLDVRQRLARNLYDNQDEEITAESTSIKVPVETSEPVIKKRIMVVEDNDLYRDMLMKILREAGFDTNGFGNGLDAIKHLDDHTYDMILMDLFMPGIDGYNTTINIRKNTPCKDVPIVALTGNRNKEIIRKWVQKGLSGYILKPSSKDKIVQTINSLL
ncbi:response regulator [Pseudoalteromonas fenneropenaei]|uniref:Response regulator n=1 Tax=Pseudoalteromonas fenneropenaei TaxID=1737459 RepID=A0ABV7CJK3_9GAMM